MSEEELAKRFGWWWGNSTKALHGKFPDEFLSFQSDYELQRAAFDYELASRAQGKRPRYLLGKCFDKLTYREMCVVMDRWGRGMQQTAPFIDYRYIEVPLALEEVLVPEEHELAARKRLHGPSLLQI
jgi:hypothetical protein